MAKINRNTNVPVDRLQPRSVGVPHIYPQRPAHQQPYDVGGAVRGIIGEVGRAAAVYEDMNEEEHRQLLISERNNVTKLFIDFDYASIQPQGKESVFDAVQRTLQSNERFNTLHPENQAKLLENVAKNYVRIELARHEEGIRADMWGEKQAMAVRLANPVLRVQAVADFPAWHRQASKVMTPEQALEPIKAALADAEARGDKEAIEQLAPIAEQFGTLADDVAKARSGVDAAALAIANREDAERRRQEAAYLDTKLGAAVQFDTDNPNATVKERNAFFDNLILSVEEADIKSKSKLQFRRDAMSYKNQTGSVDYSAMNALDDRILSSLKSQTPDDSIPAAIRRLHMQGGMGRGAKALQTRDSMLQRYQSGKLSALWTAMDPARDEFVFDIEGGMPDEDTAQARFLYDSDIREWISLNPTASLSDAFQYASELSATMKKQSDTERQTQFDQLLRDERERNARPVIETDEEQELLLPGTRYIGPDGIERIKQ